jgi:tetratricopeptide (TPR) repeat protein
MSRLFRLQAEQQKEAQRTALLDKSIESLKEAIERFGKMGDFGPTHPEVGDCYSLLGRTYLVAGRLREADAAVKKAYRLISDEGSKDYLDLVILSGDVQMAHGDRQAAAALYDQALALKDHDDPEISELRARAYIARGRNREAMNHLQGARTDYEKAAEIYQKLGETEASAGAKWEELRLRGTVPREAARLLEGERVTVRIAALTLHEKRSSMRTPSAVAQRRATSKTYWQQLIREAHTQAAVEEKPW